MPRGDKNTIPDFTIPVPSLPGQERMVKLVESKGKKIEDAKAVIASRKIFVWKNMCLIISTLK